MRTCLREENASVPELGFYHRTVALCVTLSHPSPQRRDPPRGFARSRGEPYLAVRMARFFEQLQAHISILEIIPIIA
jgi:hypothetical protein